MSTRRLPFTLEHLLTRSPSRPGWFLFHSMHSLCGIIGSCRHLLSLTLFLPADSAAWTQSLCNSFNDVGDSPGLAELIPLLTLRAPLQLKNLQTLTKDLEPSSSAPHCGGAGRHEGMDVGWRPKRDMSMWAVSQVSICHLHCPFYDSSAHSYSARHSSSNLSEHSRISILFDYAESRAIPQLYLLLPDIP